MPAHPDDRRLRRILIGVVAAWLAVTLSLWAATGCDPEVEICDATDTAAA